MDDFSDTPNSVPLRLTTLDQLPSSIARPVYDRAALSPGIVHIGLGNFHRGHQAWYLHRLMQQGYAQDWAIIGAGVRPYDRAMRDKLLAQDCLTTLIELDPARVSAEITGSMIDYLPIEPDNAALIAQMADPRIRIVSLTVTEGGYFQTSEGKFDLDHADIRHDAAHPRTPRTAFGAMVEALRLRRAAGSGPFTAMCCDNLQNNGAILKQCLLGLAKLTDADLAAWIEAEVAFPNAMVDCIVPATGADVLAQARLLGIADDAPVSHEPFRQWAIEDRFCAGRPPWERVGATLTQDVHSYEAMKIRILNGGHQLLANVGEVLSIPTIGACMRDEEIAGFFSRVQREEILPCVDAVPGMPGEDYLDLVTRRFSNPKIHDTTRRVAFDGSSRHAGFLLPSVRDALAAGRSVSGLALAEALWARMCAGTREDGSAIEPNDPFWSDLTAVAQAARSAPLTWIEQDMPYGQLASEPAFAEPFADWLDLLWREGCRATLARYAAS